MIEKKVVNRNVAFALGAMCVILIVCFIGAMIYYNSLILEKDNVIQNKDSQIQSLTSQKNQMQTWLDGNVSLLSLTQTWLNDNITYYNAQTVSLQSQINGLMEPKLILVNLKSNDNRILYQPYLHVYGEVCNVGTNTAYNCKLHVIAYQSGGVVTINTDIILDVISGESWKSVDTNIYYTGSALTGWTITAEWTS